MKFMDKAKRFFTLNAANHEGFTLVELIVVIAILAILAGVAVPVYSGYIKRAEKAADLQLLDAVNSAFGAACMVDEKSAVDIKSAALEWSGKKVVGIKSIDGADLATVQEAFEMFYGDNKNTEFKYFEEGKLVFAGGVFVDLENVETVTVTYAGSTVTVSAEALLALQNSTYGDIGGDALLEKVDLVTSIAASMAGTKLEAVFADKDFLDAAMLAMGSTTLEDFNQKSGAIISTLVNEHGLTPEEAQAQVNANAAVLYASQNAVKYTDEQIANLFSGDFKSSTITANLKANGQTAEGMAQATLVYGMYTAYANQPGNEHLKDTTNDPLAVLRALDNDENFRNYALSEQGKTDMEAFQGALGVIVDATSNNEQATTDLMLNGYNNDQLKDVIGSLLG